MGIVYSDAEEEDRTLLRGVVGQYFPELSVLSCELVIDLRMAKAQGDDEEESDKSAVKRHGFPVPAKVAVVGPVERSRGGPDVRVVVDESRWAEMGEEARKACLFSELNRIQPRRDKHGALKLDPYDRPMIRLRPYDYCVAGYVESVRTFGDESVERRELDEVEESLRQLGLPFEAAAV